LNIFPLLLFSFIMVLAGGVRRLRRDLAADEKI
jgi:hypothetical protein